jgi:large subunit ribosomal protein L24e
MVKSSFSGKEIPPGTGIMYVKKDGKILHFMSRKEEKNMLKLGRKPRTTTWTEEYRKEKVQRAAAAEHRAEEKKAKKSSKSKK